MAVEGWKSLSLAAAQLLQSLCSNSICIFERALMVLPLLWF